MPGVCAMLCKDATWSANANGMLLTNIRLRSYIKITVATGAKDPKPVRQIAPYAFVCVS